MHPWFAQHLQAELERFLPDPFDDICAMLRAGEPFTFSRFGDGEFNAVFGVEGANSDGQRYFPDLGRRLRGIVESPPDYMMGLQTLAVMVHGAIPIRELSGGASWVLADSLHNASMEGNLGRFLEALEGREVILAGAPYHRVLAEEKDWQFEEIPYGDCWPQYEALRGCLEPLAEARRGAVFLLCASMTANVILDDLYRRNPGNTYIDVGSVLDPYAGVRSRTYHDELASDPLRGIV